MPHSNGDAQKTIKQTKSGFDQKTMPSPKKKEISKSNAKLIKYSLQATKLSLWGGYGAPEGGLGGGRAVFE